MAWRVRLSDGTAPHNRHGVLEPDFDERVRVKSIDIKAIGDWKPSARGPFPGFGRGAAAAGD